MDERLSYCHAIGVTSPFGLELRCAGYYDFVEECFLRYAGSCDFAQLNISRISADGVVWRPRLYLILYLVGIQFFFVLPLLYWRYSSLGPELSESSFVLCIESVSEVYRILLKAIQFTYVTSVVSPSSFPLVTRRELLDFREEFLDTWLWLGEESVLFLSTTSWQE